jgi:hypothetical protein
VWRERARCKRVSFWAENLRFWDTGLNMLENRATHVASGYAMLMPLTLRVMEKLR